MRHEAELQHGIGNGCAQRIRDLHFSAVPIQAKIAASLLHQGREHAVAQVFSYRRIRLVLRHDEQHRVLRNFPLVQQKIRHGTFCRRLDASRTAVFMVNYHLDSLKYGRRAAIAVETDDKGFVVKGRLILG